MNNMVEENIFYYNDPSLTSNHLNLGTYESQESDTTCSKISMQKSITKLSNKQKCQIRKQKQGSSKKFQLTKEERTQLKQERKVQQQIRNRLSAQRSRDQKKVQYDQMQQRIHELIGEKQDLQQQIQDFLSDQKIQEQKQIQIQKQKFVCNQCNSTDVSPTQSLYYDSDDEDKIANDSNQTSLARSDSNSSWFNFNSSYLIALFCLICAFQLMFMNQPQRSVQLIAQPQSFQQVSFPINPVDFKQLQNSPLYQCKHQILEQLEEYENNPDPEIKYKQIVKKVIKLEDQEIQTSNQLQMQANPKKFYCQNTTTQIDQDGVFPIVNINKIENKQYLHLVLSKNQLLPERNKTIYKPNKQNNAKYVELFAQIEHINEL